jgi:hypothetical protein
MPLSKAMCVVDAGGAEAVVELEVDTALLGGACAEGRCEARVEEEDDTPVKYLRP